MNILAIESSCDETAAAIVSGNPSSDQPPTLLANVVVSQIDIFKEYGGVIPEVAARSHLEAILPVIHQAFEKAGFVIDPVKETTKNHAKDVAKNIPNLEQSPSKTHPQDDWSKIDAIAVTHTPGLLGSLLVGTLAARTLAILHNKPLYAIHHLKSHIYANWLTETKSNCQKTEPSPTFPLLALVISGGHTQIIHMNAHNHFEIIGTTLDDAVGECFDKVAKILGLPYPGGPAISQAANGEITSIKKATGKKLTTKVSPGNPSRYPLPHPRVNNLDFSFSGLKTAVLRSVQKATNVPISYPSHQLSNLLDNQQKADFAASFEETVCEILINKLKRALAQYPNTRSIVIAGGVSANKRLKEKLTNTTSPSKLTNSNDNKSTKQLVSPKQPQIFFPEQRFSGDNAAMVGAAAFYEIANDAQPTDPYKLNILPRSDIS